MVSKLKQRRTRRLKADVAWWKAESHDLYIRVMEQADEIALLRSQVLRIPMPVMVPADIIYQLDNKMCKACNDGLRCGCSSCAYRNR
ncbi:hypothetical protein UWO_00950 [Escherichia coli O32:H37 str. P4]|nr:hypothetical protein UWO_00950 [Escherichia coli O32:H37 str. P4]RCA61103.1 hypothetical protein C6A39_23305 [Escherichia coli]